MEKHEIVIADGVVSVTEPHVRIVQDVNGNDVELPGGTHRRTISLGDYMPDNPTGQDGAEAVAKFEAEVLEVMERLLGQDLIEICISGAKLKAELDHSVARAEAAEADCKILVESTRDAMAAASAKVKELQIKNEELTARLHFLGADEG